jgi:hypothetical protein
MLGIADEPECLLLFLLIQGRDWEQTRITRTIGSPHKRIGFFQGSQTINDLSSVVYCPQAPSNFRLQHMIFAERSQRRADAPEKPLVGR